MKFKRILSVALVCAVMISCVRGLWEYNIGSDVTNSLDYTLTQDAKIFAQ